MQRKPSYPVANCSIKMPDGPSMDLQVCDDDCEQHQKRQHLINFAHSQWGFNNWSWSVTKQELDFVDFANGKYCAGVVAFVSIKLKSLDIYRENIGYATSTANTKGLAIYKSRKCAVTNALRETLLSFGGKMATELLESLETRTDVPSNAPGGNATPHVSVNLVGAPLVSTTNSPLVTASNSPLCVPVTIDNENNQNVANRLEPKTSPSLVTRKEEPRPAAVPPVARAMPMPATLPRAPPNPAPAPIRPNSNDLKTGLEGMTEEEARAERRRRQRLAQDEFKQRQLMKNTGMDENHEISKCSSSIDKLLMDIPTQDIVIDQTAPMADAGKRKSPTPNYVRAKRRSSINKLNILEN